MTSSNSGIRPSEAAGDASRSEEEEQGCSPGSFFGEHFSVAPTLALSAELTQLGDLN